MRKHAFQLRLSAISLCGSSLFGQPLFAQPLGTIDGWDVYQDDEYCSASRLKGDRFVFISEDAQGTLGIRAHKGDWKLQVGRPYLITLTAGGETLTMYAVGLDTVQKTSGFGGPIKPETLAAAAAAGTVEARADGVELGEIDLAGAQQAVATMRECAGRLHPKSDDEMPVGNPVMQSMSFMQSFRVPPAARREMTSPRVAFRLQVGADGKPTDCAIMQSSGSKLLDDRICEIMLKRARFEPAVNRAGKPVAASYTNSVAIPQ